jgi:hypothetical protein
MALQAVVFLGSTPIGGPITGVIADRASVEWALGYGSVISLLVVAGASVYWLATAPQGAEKAIAR